MNYVRRLATLADELKRQDLEAFLISHPIDIYYFTGKILSEGRLLMKQGKPLLLVDGRYFAACQLDCPAEVLLSKGNHFLDLLKGIKTLGVDTETTSLEMYLELSKTAAPLNIELHHTKSLVKWIRAVKDEEELAILRDAATLGSEGFDYLLTLLKEGISESALAFELEFYWRKKGASGVAFSPIIAFDKNSSMPHYRAGDAFLKKNSSILIDIGVLYRHYHSDMTRVVFCESAPKELLKIRDIVEEASSNALSLVKPGVSGAKLDEAARSLIAKKGYGDYFTHSLGHGVGLEIHELPTLKRSESGEGAILQEKMVITIEPGIYIPGLGGVRLEDTVIVTATGYEDLTKRPKNISISL